jgi:SAM-dependent methyltransferase
MASRARQARGRSRRAWRSARTSDRHELYEKSVQDPQSECAYIERIYRGLRGRAPVSLREDFCGTALVSRMWVRRKGRVAHGVDLDPEVLAWAKARAATDLGDDARSRLSLLKGDVRTVRTAPVDVLVAMNFSTFVFHTRAALLEYCRSARTRLKRDGVIIVDAYGGSGSWTEQEEERNLDGFTYVWDQAMVNPVTGRVRNHIHYRFPDGTSLRRAFTYDWRLWTLPEIQEVMVEAGFRRPVVYWEGTTKDGEGNGVFRPSARGEACEAWVAYIAAEA